MRANQEKQERDAPKLEEDVLLDLQRIEDGLLSGLDEDARLSSGVPEGQSSADLDFIQMTGLTRPAAPLTYDSPPSPDLSALDKTTPVSFYEKGVADVDASMTPVGTEDAETDGSEFLRDVHSGDEEILPAGRDAYDVAELKQIIGDLGEMTGLGMTQEGSPSSVEEAAAAEEFPSSPLGADDAEHTVEQAPDNRELSNGPDSEPECADSADITALDGAPDSSEYEVAAPAPPAVADPADSAAFDHLLDSIVSANSEPPAPEASETVDLETSDGVLDSPEHEGPTPAPPEVPDDVDLAMYDRPEDSFERVVSDMAASENSDTADLEALDGVLDAEHETVAPTPSEVPDDADLAILDGAVDAFEQEVAAPTPPEAADTMGFVHFGDDFGRAENSVSEEELGEFTETPEGSSADTEEDHPEHTIFLSANDSLADLLAREMAHEHGPEEAFLATEPEEVTEVLDEGLVDPVSDIPTDAWPEMGGEPPSELPPRHLEEPIGETSPEAAISPTFEDAGGGAMQLPDWAGYAAMDLPLLEPLQESLEVPNLDEAPEGVTDDALGQAVDADAALRTYWGAAFDGAEDRLAANDASQTGAEFTDIDESSYDLSGSPQNNEAFFTSLSSDSSTFAAPDEETPLPSARFSPDEAFTETSDATPSETDSGLQGTVPLHHDLAEVELLLKQLQEQPRDVSSDATPAVIPSASALPLVTREQSASDGSDSEYPDSDELTAEESGSEKDGSVYRRPANRRPRRRGHSQHRMRRRIVRWGVWSAAALISVCTGYFAYRYTMLQLAAPETFLNNAASLAATGDYRQAAQQYESFSVKNPDHALRAEAQFNAAFYTQLIPNQSRISVDSPATGAIYEQSIRQLREFIEANPLHPKVARAQTLIGLLQFKLQKYDDAINQLHDPDLRIKDPGAALVILRTLARAYARKGDFETAQSEYLQAISMSDNYSPDVDYHELSDLCKTMADHAQAPEEQQRYLGLATEYLANSLRVPGIDPFLKNDIKREQNVLDSELREAIGKPATESEGAAHAATTEPVADPASTQGSAGAPADAAAPDHASSMNADPNPVSEAAQLGIEATVNRVSESTVSTP